MEKLNALIKRYQEGTATSEERALVEWYFLQTMERQSIPGNETIKQEIFDNLNKRYRLQKAGSVFQLSRIKYFAAAAILLIALISTWYLVYHRQPWNRPQIVDARDIQPGTNRATLTLSNGRTIDLSDGQTGIVVGTEVTYLDGTEVAEAEGVKNENLMSLTTPKGGTYNITLPDGSRVWLNAASTLTYPSRFIGSERLVEISGEAFFSVAKDKNRPFRVTSRDQEINVLGTEFNVSAYPDENEVKTTLVNGSVEIVNRIARTTQRIAPGEQAVTRDANTSILQVNTETFTAWKDGYFKLDGTLGSVMAQISRWYDVEVIVGKGVDTNMELIGKVSRDAKLSDILWMINEIDNSLKFKVEEIHGNQRERRLSLMK